MARDRLAAMRNGVGAGGVDYEDYTTYGQAPAYPSTRRTNNSRPNRASFTPPPSFEDEKDYTRLPTTNPFQDQPPMEMSTYSTKKTKGPREVSTTEEFFESIASLQTDLKELQYMIDNIHDLSKRGLDSTSTQDNIKQESVQLTEDIRNSISHIKSTIQSFEADHSLLKQRNDPQANLNVRSQQLAGFKKRFIETVQRYAEVEQNMRKAIKARVERQIRIVNPNATDEEVRLAVQDEVNGGGGAVFQQALVSSNRMGSARNALREVQSRAEDMRRIEQTITELAQLFNDMATMVEEQDVAVQTIEKQAEAVNMDVEAASTELKTAVVSAKGARSKRKWCCMILVLIILVLGGGIAVYILFKNGVIGGNANNAAAASNATTATTPATSTHTNTATVNGTRSTRL